MAPVRNLSVDRGSADRGSNGASTLSAEERLRLLVEWNRTDLAFDRTRCIHHLIERQVERTPEKTAIVCRDQTLTYRQLNDRAQRLANHLTALGVGPESVVGVCMERSADLPVALLGVLKAGGAYLPLDPAFPDERIDLMLSDSEAATILTQACMAHRFAGRTKRVVAADTLCDEDGLTNARPPGPDNLAYLIYTSGSTGTPKGVMVEHRNVVNFFAAMDQILGGEPGVWLAVTSISFDISVLELLWTLTRGFTVILQTDEGKLLVSGKYSLPEQLRRYRVSHFQCTPTLAKILLSSPAVSAMKDLRVMLVGGEAMLPPLATQLRATLDSAIYNMYGPTETTIWSTAYSVKGDELSVPIGRPIANTQVYILNDNLQPVPASVIGELYIGGSGVARGYWKRPELTAGRFISAPGLGGRGLLYRTGDLVRYRSDGIIEFVGRSDHQVKIRGFRVELGEVETVLGRHLGVQDAVVTLDETGAGDPQLIAYVVPSERSNVSQKELSIYLRQKLPEYMVPSTVVFLRALPTTPNGKVDRRALPRPRSAFSSPVPMSLARTDLEGTISEVWKDVLGLDTVGLHENLFDLGANSLMVAQAAIALAPVLDRPVTVIDLFAYPTVSSLAGYLSGEHEPAAALGMAAARASARRESQLRRARFK